MKRVVTLLIVTCLLAGSFAQAESKAKYDVGKTYPSDAEPLQVTGKVNGARAKNSRISAPRYFL
jgi:hypothetical protein